MMQNLPKTVQCVCGSYQLQFVRRKGKSVSFRCTNCRMTITEPSYWRKGTPIKRKSK